MAPAAIARRSAATGHVLRRAVIGLEAAEDEMSALGRPGERASRPAGQARRRSGRHRHRFRSKTRSRVPAASAAASIIATCAASSAQTAIVPRRASAAKRAILRALATSLLIRMSEIPAQARISASPTFCTHCPTAPRAICRCAMTGDLCVLACARRRTSVPGEVRGHQVEIGFEGIEIEEKRRGIDVFFAHARLSRR